MGAGQCVMKKLLLTVLILSVLIGVLAACGDGLFGPDSSSDSSTRPPFGTSAGSGASVGTADPTGVDRPDSSTPADSDTGNPPDSSAPSSTPPVTEAPPEWETVALAGSEIYTGSLILVNASSPYCYRIASMASPGELDKLSDSVLSELGWTSLYANKTGDFLLRSRMLFLKSDAYAAFRRMMQTFASRTGHKDVQVRYAYQWVSETKDAASLADERITGLALEINIYTEEGTFSIDHSAKRADYFEWFAANCHAFGFLMNGESGYFRYVGVPHATYMKRHNLSLEAYLGFLRNFTAESPLSVVDDDGILWSVWYVPVGEKTLTEVKYPKGATPTVSGNNRDGFIVTCR